MSGSLFDQAGRRKYLTARERFAFAREAYRQGGEVATFCLTLAFTGARISEVLALTPDRIDGGDGVIVFETLKRRKAGVYRAVPVPMNLITMLRRVHNLGAVGRDPKERLWKWCRTTAWKRVKAVMQAANIGDQLAMPRAARHAFGANSTQNAVPLNMIQRWMGHARIETTAIYTDVIGSEERKLARRAWSSFELAIRDREIS